MKKMSPMILTERRTFSFLSNRYIVFLQFRTIHTLGPGFCSRSPMPSSKFECFWYKHHACVSPNLDAAAFWVEASVVDLTRAMVIEFFFCQIHSQVLIWHAWPLMFVQCFSGKKTPVCFFLTLAEANSSLELLLRLGHGKRWCQAAREPN